MRKWSVFKHPNFVVYLSAMSNRFPHVSKNFLSRCKVIVFVSPNHEGQCSGWGCVDSAGDWSIDEDGSFGTGSLWHGSTNCRVDSAAVNQQSTRLKIRKICLFLYQLTKIIKDFLSSPKAWPSILKLKAIYHLYPLQDTTGLSVASDNSVVVWQHGQNAGRFCGNLWKIKAI